MYIGTENLDTIEKEGYSKGCKTLNELVEVPGIPLRSSLQSEYKTSAYQAKGQIEEQTKLESRHILVTSTGKVDVKDTKVSSKEWEVLSAFKYGSVENKEIITVESVRCSTKKEHAVDGTALSSPCDLEKIDLMNFEAGLVNFEPVGVNDKVEPNSI
eukprot:TRINITY_DN336_c0_g1_i6.p1 TRINITY_DN336_c0_g1~~TRINITY_DN336_c0_g1_i6.p1  ORF type:complete len:157 (-),score=13.71 TRINITY_DN336_c0_g1_i6:288-758(-)